jgi:ankyrin repeat protein
VKNGHEETINLLLRNGAKISMRENQIASILCQAVYDGEATLLRRLLKAGVSVNASDYDKRTGKNNRLSSRMSELVLK